MHIDRTNYRAGNKAIASVLLLYYHLIRDDGIPHDQTVYLDADDFDGFMFLNVTVDGAYQSEIDQDLLREGAIIYLLCDLGDLISEYGDTYLHHPLIQKLIMERQKGSFSAIPETNRIIDMLINYTESSDFEEYHQIQFKIYQKYVVNRLSQLTSKSNQT